MDAFRLLTRSTKLKVGGPQRPSSNQLPSAGKAENPQLFPDHQHKDAGCGGKKRKRGDAEEEGTIAEDVLGLNFFAPRKAAPQEDDAPKGKKNKNKKNQTTQEQPEDADPVNEEEVPPMLEDERKALLKSHKIKITDMRVLEKPEPEPAKDSKKKRKKSKQKEERPPVMSKKQRKEAQRLYPQPLMRFQELRSRYRISRRLAGNVFNQGYSMPTEVQLGTLPLQLGVRSTSTSSTDRISDPDLLVVAPTGSGKTIAFLIPLINKIIVHHHENPDFRGLLSIVVAPTKELASQIVNEGRKLVVGTGVRITAMKKGMRVVERGEDDEKQILDEGSDSGSDESDEGEDESNKPVSRATITKSDILVTTPLQLINSLSDNQTKSVAPLPTVRSLVLDEADVLLDPLFREQTLGIWRACTHAELRVGLWSATMGSNIEELTKSTIKEREDSLGLSTTAPLLRLVVGLKDSAIPNITHKLTYAATEQGKLLGLRQLLHPTTMSDDHLRPPFLVFTQTIPRAVALHSELLYDIPAEAGGSSRIAVLHSDLSDQQRSDVMTGFRKGEIWILITTDLLARGVDFRGINGVVNYDIPNSSASYVHRVGRTGRAGRQGGIAVTFYTKEDIPYVKNIANVIAASEKLRGEGGTKSVEKWLLDALPDLSKKDKKDLKRHGVQARRSAVKLDPTGKGKRKMQISTKSGFERRMENRRKGAVQGSLRRKAQEQTQAREGHGSGADEEWGGIEE